MKPLNENLKNTTTTPENDIENIDKIYQLSIEPYHERYYNNESDYGIYLCHDKNLTDLWGDDTITLVGSTPRLTIGKLYSIAATKVIHPKFGEQYKIQSIELNMPTTIYDEQEFLKMIVSEDQFKRITEVYLQPITAIREGTFDISKIKGIKEKRLEVIKRKIHENIHLIYIASEIGKFGIAYKEIRKIVNHFGNAELALQKIKENPYILYEEVNGFGFQKTDELALRMGIDKNSDKRLMAAILYSIEQEENKGNCYSFIMDIQSSAESLLDMVIPNFNELIQSDKFYNDGYRIERKKLFNAEIDICNLLYDIQKEPITYFDKEEDVTNIIKEVESDIGIVYDEAQKELFYKINDNNIVVFTGFAGTGKSTVTRGVLDMFDRQETSYLLIAPTAKAAKVMTRSTGRPASTIHRGLGWTPEGFEYNKNNKFPYDVIIIDEFSMVGIFLFKDVLEAIKQGAKLIVIGDPGQLESISLGNLLQDMMTSGLLPTVQLTKIHRQAEESGILSIATKTRHGEIFFSPNDTTLEFGKTKDCKIWFGVKENTADRAMTIYKDCIEHYSTSDIMVISPIKKGSSGVIEMNRRIQELVNPSDNNKHELVLKKCVFREGDYVMHRKNLYSAEWLDENYDPIGELGIFNGDTGFIKEIIPNKKLVYVEYEGRIMEYGQDDLEYLDLCYACSVHLVQGSQAPVVIMLLDFSHYINLKRNLDYTGFTRAKEYLYIITEAKALKYSIDNNSIIQRRTWFKELLQLRFDTDDISFKTIDNSNIM